MDLTVGKDGTVPEVRHGVSSIHRQRIQHYTK